MTPKISIIVPIYNVEQYLDRCMQSLLNQTLKDIEIILVDDQSPDNCPAICDKYVEQYPNTRVVHKKNEGLGMACNSGLDVATGKYVAFLDSDDWVDAPMYENMYFAAEKYKAQLVFTGLRRVDKEGVESIMSQATELQVYNIPEKINTFMLGMIASDPSVGLERQVQMSAKVVLYDRKFIETYHIRFESERHLISEDLFFNLDNLMKAECVVELPKTYYNYFINNTSLSQTIRTDRFEKSVIMRNELFRRYSPITAELHTRVNRMFIGYTRAALCQICTTPTLKFSKKKQLIRTVCKHPVWKEIQQTYPIKQMPLIHKVFLLSILWKQFFLIYAFAKLKAN